MIYLILSPLRLTGTMGEIDESKPGAKIRWYWSRGPPSFANGLLQQYNPLVGRTATLLSLSMLFVLFCSLVEEIKSVHASFPPNSSSSAATDEESSLVANPLNAFHLIKRFATTWRQIWQLTSNFSAHHCMPV